MERDAIKAMVFLIVWFMPVYKLKVRYAECEEEKEINIDRQHVEKHKSLNQVSHEHTYNERLENRGLRKARNYLLLATTASPRPHKRKKSPEKNNKH